MTAAVAETKRGGSIERYPALDEVRGLAVVTATTYHCFLSTPSIGARRVDHWIDTLLPIATMSLDVFFVISGFLITLILCRTREADHTIRTFYYRRALRIIPLYYGFLAFAWLFLRGLGPRAIGEPGAMKWEWLFLTNVSFALEGGKHVGSLFPHFWSLAVEEHFYLIWPWVIVFASPKLFIRITLFLVVGSFVGRVILAANGFAYASWLLTPTRLDGLALGSFVALMHLHKSDVLRKWSRPLIAVVVLSILWVIGGQIFGVATAKARSLTYGTVTSPLLGSLIAASLVGYLASRNSSRKASGIVGNFLNSSARYSYGIYAVHIPIIVILFAKTNIKPSMPVDGYEFPYRLLFSLTVFTLSFIIGMCSWHFYEKQVLKLAPRYRYSSRKASESRAGELSALTVH